MVLGVVVALLPSTPSHAVAGGSAGYQWADFDGDGFGDLAIGAPGEAIGSIREAGAVHVLYGGSSGLRSSDDQLFHQNTAGLVDGVAEAGDQFGDALAVGDFDADGFDDLAIGASSEDTGGSPDAGFVFVLYGTGSGLRTTGSQSLRQGAGGLEGASEAGDHFGAALSAGDYNDDGASDLAIGIPDEDIGSRRDAGAVALLLGDPQSGLSGATQNQFTQDTPGFDGDPEPGDRFGFALTSGNFDNRGEDDLAIGVPFEDVGVHADEGVVHTVLGGPTGLDRTKADVINQDTIFRERDGFDDELFGFSLASGDFDPVATAPARYDDLVIGVPGDLVNNSGAVDVVLGSEEGFVGRGEEWFQGKAGAARGAVFGAREASDEFGSTVTVNDFDNNGAADMAIGVRGEDIGNANNVGGVHVIYSDGTNLDPSIGPNQFFSQASPKMPGEAETGDLFGGSLVSGNYDAANGADLAIGVPLEDTGSAVDAGVLHVLYGAAVGPLSTRDADLWSQNAIGIQGRSEPTDRFGAAGG